MTKAAHTVLEMAMGLEPEERLMVVDRLLEATRPPGLSIDDPGFADEIVRRAADLDSGKTEAEPWETALAGIRATLERSR